MDTFYDFTFCESVNMLDSLSQQCKSEMESWGYIDTEVIEKTDSSLDAWDYCFSIAVGMASAKITTSEQLEVYLNEIHHAASGATGDYTKLQAFLGSLLNHQGDAIDKLETKKFVNRAYKAADIGYHRLLWGHDIFSFGADNPFKLMFDQKGVVGILQAVRHLIADTTSKQGLPFPGSSYFDYSGEDGKVSNYIINVAKNLSEESVGNKRNAQTIYSHMFTVRAQDIMGGGAIAGFAAMYFKIRGIEDTIRKVQFRLIAYSVAFFGEALLGAAKQGGVPYINIPLATAVFKNLAQLYYYSIKETRQLQDKTYELIARGDELKTLVDDTGKGLVSYDNADAYIDELLQGQDHVDSLIESFERRRS